VGKKHGASRGPFLVVAVTKGVDTCTRVVLGSTSAFPATAKTPSPCGSCSGSTTVGRTFPVLLYAEQMKPVYLQNLTTEYGIYCVSPNYARRASKTGSTAAKNPKRVSMGPVGPRTPVGLRRRRGVARDAAKLAYETALESVLHEADGYQHQHHLAADGGALCRTRRPLRRSPR
jgi:hypothetical protein